MPYGKDSRRYEGAAYEKSWGVESTFLVDTAGRAKASPGQRSTASVRRRTSLHHTEKRQRAMTTV